MVSVFCCLSVLNLFIILVIDHVLEQDRDQAAQEGAQHPRLHLSLTEGCPELARLQCNTLIPVQHLHQAGAHCLPYSRVGVMSRGKQARHVAAATEWVSEEVQQSGDEDLAGELLKPRDLLIKLFGHILADLQREIQWVFMHMLTPITDKDAHLVQSIQAAFKGVYVRPFKALHAGWDKLRPCFQAAQPDYDCYTCTHSLP
ncbi:MAG: hypothetical protein FRX49_11934 [Trebouxia sp. A1-2]|nr:MAG: hypothetical protein FRX49_11934 [Trebouxia sp. A1-2]